MELVKENDLNKAKFLIHYSKLYPDQIRFKDNNVMLVKIPTYYDRLQSIHLSKNLSSQLKVLSFDDIENYFLSDKTIDYLQDIKIYDENYKDGGTVCDYCGFRLPAKPADGTSVTNSTQFYCCRLCSTVMCDTCYDNKRSFTYDNWEKIEDSKLAVNRCKKHPFFTKITLDDPLELTCNSCKSVRSMILSKTIYCNRVADYDICDKCYTEELRKKYNLVIIENKPSLLQQLYYEFFGSFLDWIPILCVENEHPTYVLINLNPNSLLFEYIAIYYQEDEYYKMIVIHYSLEKLLDELETTFLIEENNILDEFLVKYMDYLLTNCLFNNT